MPTTALRRALLASTLAVIAMVLTVAALAPSASTPTPTPTQTSEEVDGVAAAECATHLTLDGPTMEPNGTPLIERIPECADLNTATQAEALYLAST